MFKSLNHDLRTAVVAVATASVVMAAPAAAIVANADKVDGKHAVGAAATRETRAGKLVATNRNGYLPNDILLKARNANKLDGKSSSAFLAAKGKAANSDKLDGRSLSRVRSIQNSRTFGVSNLTVAAANVTSIDVAAPAAGRVEVSGVVALSVDKANSTSGAWAVLSISDVANTMTNPVSRWALPVGAPAGTWQATVAVTRTFTVSSAGTYTYYLVGRGFGGTDVFEGTLNAQFFPGN